MALRIAILNGIFAAGFWATKHAFANGTVAEVMDHSLRRVTGTLMLGSVGGLVF